MTAIQILKKEIDWTSPFFVKKELDCNEYFGELAYMSFTDEVEFKPLNFRSFR